MEVTPGYKQTVLGLLPEEWDVLPLRDACRSICDGTHFTPRYVPQGVPFYSVENITAADFVNTTFISEHEHIQLIKRCKPERGDILMTRITAGVLGATKLLDWDVNASIYVSLALLKPNDRVVPEYLYRYTQSPAFRRDVEKRGLLNATPKKINMRDIGDIPIPAPLQAHEQKAIAQALSDIDELIQSLERLIAKKRDLKQAAMQQLLTGQTRLPGFSGEWPERSFADLFIFSGGFSASREQLSHVGHCYLHYGDIHMSTRTCINLQTDLDSIPRLAVALNQVSPASLLADGDVVFVDASEDIDGTFTPLWRRVGMARLIVNTSDSAFRRRPSNASSAFTQLARRFRASARRTSHGCRCRCRLCQNKRPSPKFSPTWTLRAPPLKPGSPRPATSSRA